MKPDWDALAAEFDYARVKNGGRVTSRAEAAYIELQRLIGNAVDGAVGRAVGESVLRGLSGVQDLLRKPLVDATGSAEAEKPGAVKCAGDESDDDDDFV